MQSVDLARDAFALVDVHILAWVGTQRGPSEDPIHGEGEEDGVHQGGGDVAGGGRHSPPPPRNQSGCHPPSNLLLWLLSRDPRWASRPLTLPSCSSFAGSGTKLSPGKWESFRKSIFWVERGTIEMVDLETRLGGEGGVNVRFVNNFLEERWSPAQRLNHYEARARSRLDCSKYFHFAICICMSQWLCPYAQLRFHCLKLFISVFSSPPSFLILNHNWYLHICEAIIWTPVLINCVVMQFSISSMLCNAEGAVSVECLNHDGGREARCPGLSYAIIPPDQPCAPSPA